MDKQSEFTDPCKGRSISNRDERWIPISGHENELVPWRGPAIWSVQEKVTEIKVCRTREHPNTRYPPRDPFRSPEPPRQLTSINPSIHAEAVDKIYPDQTNALRKAGLEPYIFPTMEDLWIKQDEKMENNKEQYISVKKNRNFCFCAAYSRYFSTAIHRVIDRLKSNLTSHG